MKVSFVWHEIKPYLLTYVQLETWNQHSATYQLFCLTEVYNLQGRSLTRPVQSNSTSLVLAPSLQLSLHITKLRLLLFRWMTSMVLVIHGVIGRLHVRPSIQSSCLSFGPSIVSSCHQHNWVRTPFWHIWQRGRHHPGTTHPPVQRKKPSSLCQFISKK